MKKKIYLLLLLLAAAILAGCTEQETAQAPELLEPVGVQSDMAAAYIGEIFDITYYNGSVKPYVEELFFEVDGMVDAMNVYPGMTVSQGDVLIELDQTDLEDYAEALMSDLTYADRDNAYSDALAELDIEILQLELRRLMETGAGDKEIALKENEIAQRQASLRQTQEMRESDLSRKRQELEKVRKSLDKNVMRAPFDGRIIYGRDVRNGSWVSAYTPVGYIADDSRLSIVSEYIPESVIGSADRVCALVGGTEYEIELIPIDQKEYVSMMLANETITTQFSIIGPEEALGELEAGQYAAILVYDHYIPDALLVPSGAVLRDASGRYVYVDENGARVRRPVKIGKVTDGLTQILEGLEEGEVVYVKD